MPMFDEGLAFCRKCGDRLCGTGDYCADCLPDVEAHHRPLPSATRVLAHVAGLRTPMAIHVTRLLGMLFNQETDLADLDAIVELFTHEGIRWARGDWS